MKLIAESTNMDVYVVLNPRHEHVATLHVRSSPSGAVQCDTYTRKDPTKNHLSLTGQRTVGGGGYNKRSAAIAGSVIDGYKLCDDCGNAEEPGERQRTALMKAYRKARQTALPFDGDHEYPRSIDAKFRAKAAKIGARFTNHDEHDGYLSLYFDVGLARLEALGYTVIKSL